MRKSILLILGTRPEAIKLAPVILTLRDRRDYSVKTCVTGQHQDLVDPVLRHFGIWPDYRLKHAGYTTSLSRLAGHMLGELDKVINNIRPDLVIVQGDTTNTFVGA